MVAEKFQIYGVKIIVKDICESKSKWICSFLLMLPKQNSPPGSYHYPKTEESYPYP